MKFYIVILIYIHFVLLYGQDISAEFYSLDKEHKFAAALELASKYNINKINDDILILMASYLYEGRKDIDVNKEQARNILLLLEKRLKNKQDSKSLYYQGLVAKYSISNFSIAYDYIKKAADAGYSDAEAEIAIMLFKGIGTKSNPLLAMDYLKKAVAQNNLTAKAYLASYYLGQKKDIQRGIVLAKESSDEGNRAGQYTIGMAYEKGIGVPKNDMKALRLYQLSADQGLGDARDRLFWLKKRLNIPEDQYIDCEQDVIRMKK